MTAEALPKRSFSTVLYVKAVAKGRPRMTRQGRAYTPAKTVNAEAEIRWLLRKENPPCLNGPIAMTVRVYIAKPKSVSKRRTHPIVKPDNSNVLKLVEDAANGILFEDDSLICDSWITKEYGDPERIEITVQEM